MYCFLIAEAYTLHYYVDDIGSAIQNYDRYSLARKVDEDMVLGHQLSLVMSVQSQIFNREHLGWVDSDAKVLYVDLKAPENENIAGKVDDDHVELF